MSRRLSFMKIFRCVAVLLVIAAAGAPPAQGECYEYTNSSAYWGPGYDNYCAGNPSSRCYQCYSESGGYGYTICTYDSTGYSYCIDYQN